MGAMGYHVANTKKRTFSMWGDMPMWWHLQEMYNFLPSLWTNWSCYCNCCYSSYPSLQSPRHSSWPHGFNNLTRWTGFSSLVTCCTKPGINVSLKWYIKSKRVLNWLKYEKNSWNKHYSWLIFTVHSQFRDL